MLVTGCWMLDIGCRLNGQVTKDFDLRGLLAINIDYNLDGLFWVEVGHSRSEYNILLRP